MSKQQNPAHKELTFQWANDHEIYILCAYMLETL